MDDQRKRLIEKAESAWEGPGRYYLTMGPCQIGISPDAGRIPARDLPELLDGVREVLNADTNADWTGWEIVRYEDGLELLYKRFAI